MKSNELRVDNWVMSAFGIVKISEIRLMECTVRSEDFYINTSVWTSKLQPVILTEDLLLKSEGTKFATGLIFVDRFSLRWLPAYKYWYVTDKSTGAYITKVEFLHEWQNVIWSLNGEELKIKL